MGKRVGPRARVLALGLGLVTVAPVTATPQELDDLEQRGLRTNAWSIFPSLAVTGTYNDNVLAEPDDSDFVEDDFAVIVAPEVSIDANTRRHAFGIDGGAEFGRFLDIDSQDYNDFFVGTNGRWDVTRTFDVSARFGFRNDHQVSTDPDRVVTDESVTETVDINRFQGQLALSKRRQRTFIRASTAVRRSVFDELEVGVFGDAEVIDGVVVPGDATDTVDLNADRDVTRIPNNLRIAYDVGRNYNLFFNTRYLLVRFDEPRQREETLEGVVVDVTEDEDDRDFESLAFRVGSELDFDRLVTGEFAVGVTRRFSGDDDGDDLGFSFDADLDWTLSPRTVLNFSGSQGFEPTTDGASLETNVGLDLSYALSRQITLNTTFAFLRDDRSEVDRTDNDFRAGAGASYRINRFASVSASYDYRQRNSSDADREFARNAVFLTVVGRY